MADNNRELTLIRIFDASRETVFKYWTNSELLAKWWGPKGFTNPISELDPRPGGAINIVMEDSEGLIKKGSRYPMKGVFQDVKEPEKIVYTAEALMGDKPIIEQIATVIFEEVSGKTKMTLHVVVTKATSEAEMPLKGMETGWSQSLDKLGEFLA